MSDSSIKRGIGGWLILVAIGVTIAPFKTAIEAVLAFKPIFAEGTWASLTTAGSALYHPGWKILLSSEIINNTILVCAYGALAVLFYKKHWLFPRLFIALQVISLLGTFVDAWALSMIMPDEPIFDAETFKAVSRSVLSCFIWIPYMLVSKRVKATFVRSPELVSLVHENS